ncbi:MAG TPA: 30S ribosomal protein S12 methylthiotransferase RimO [Dissulfurispiraceae bacterium]|nr:30S ribosomal protein S12 methylthiotransferase RimO [Dissulfurispiraceae bacterium]
MTKIALITLGCPKNVTDSRHLAERLMAEGMRIEDAAENADVILVNTCGFIKDAKEESIEEILKLAKGKASHQKLIAFGCLMKRYRDEIAEAIPELDGIFGVGETEELVKYCGAVVANKLCRTVKPVSNIAGRLQDNALWQRSYTYLKISEGCNKRCTFCVIPAIRGPFRSIPSETVLREAQQFVKQRVRELILVAQDISRYGREIEGHSLLRLLKELVAIPGDFRIRLLYLYPTEISKELLSFVASEEKILKYFDIPLQHSEDRILRLMGRQGTRSEYLKLIRTIRKAIPGVTLRTSFIVGFPGETEKDFEGLVDFIEEVRFERLGVFKYSREEGTPAARLPGQVPAKIKERRYDEIMRRQAAISLEKNEALVGKTLRAVIDEVDEDLILARLDSQAPEIDGVVLVERPEGGRLSRHIRNGSIINVTVVKAFDYDLRGVLAPDGMQAGL